MTDGRNENVMGIASSGMLSHDHGMLLAPSSPLSSSLGCCDGDASLLLLAALDEAVLACTL